MKKLLAVLAAGLVVLGCGQRNGKHTGDIRIGDAVPDFKVELLDGTTVRSGDLKGSVSVISFFTATCPDCRFSLPHIQRTYDEFTPLGVRFVNISRAVGKEEMAALWEELSLSMPYSAQEDRAGYVLFAESVIPRVYIADPGGIVRFIHTDSPNPTYEVLSAELTALLAGEQLVSDNLSLKSEEVCTDGSCD